MGWLLVGLVGASPRTGLSIPSESLPVKSTQNVVRTKCIKTVKVIFSVNAMVRTSASWDFPILLNVLVVGNPCVIPLTTLMAMVVVTVTHLKWNSWAIVAKTAAKVRNPATTNLLRGLDRPYLLSVTESILV